MQYGAKAENAIWGKNEKYMRKRIMKNTSDRHDAAPHHMIPRCTCRCTNKYRYRFKHLHKHLQQATISRMIQRHTYECIYTYSNLYQLARSARFRSNVSQSVHNEKTNARTARQTLAMSVLLAGASRLGIALGTPGRCMIAVMTWTRWQQMWQTSENHK